MKGQLLASVVEAAKACPCCRDLALEGRNRKPTQAFAYQYALRYLCGGCRDWWQEADQRAHEQAGKWPSGRSRCPWHPDECRSEPARIECRGRGGES